MSEVKQNFATITDLKKYVGHALYKNMLYTEIT